MILYHGSNVPIGEVDLGKCRPYKDFGQGFYLTSLRHQAESMARRTARIQGSGGATVTAFELDDDWRDSALSILSFEGPSREWAQFIVNNRDRGFTDLSSMLCNRLNQYDIVFGPVANDAIVASFQLYQDGRTGIDDLVERFKYRELPDQYSFHTPASLELLKNLGVC